MKITALDKLFSRYIRERAGWCCERCGTRYQRGARGLHCSHFWGRSKKSVRYDPRNASAHCHGCHAYFTSHPAEHVAWKKKQMGEQEYRKLEIDAHLPQKIDEVFIKRHLEILLGELDIHLLSKIK